MEQAREDIAIMPGKSALPRRSGEMVFQDEWEKRAFALAVSLCEQGYYAWEEFQAQLIKQIDSANEDPENPDPAAPGYYEHWLAALETLLTNKGLK